MRKITAHYIFPGNGKPLKYGILEIDDHGTILKLTDTGGKLTEQPGLEYYPGVLVPGFINTHCHLELSHLKAVIPKHTGLPNFVGKIVDKRNNKDENTQTQHAKALDAKMFASGISAVGDICNLPLTFSVKEKSPIHYSNFVELIGISEHVAEIIYAKGLEVINEAEQYIANKNSNLSDNVSCVPHAPYSVSESLFRKIWETADANNLTTSVHNQETASENSLFTGKTGELFEVLSTRGVPYYNFTATGKTSLQSILPYLPKTAPVLLVHNTFTEAADITELQKHENNPWFCLCPNANLYIENRLPKINMLHKRTTQICLGTDSLASNDQLSILEEIKTIAANFPEIPFETLLRWATRNGAEALQITQQYGSFEQGKKPGVVLLENFDFTKMSVAKNTTSRRII